MRPSKGGIRWDRFSQGGLLNRLKWITLLFLLGTGDGRAVEPTPTGGQVPSPSPTLKARGAEDPWRSVENILGKTGEPEGESFRAIFPRFDLNIMIEGVALEPELGLRSILVFHPLSKGTSLEGRLVLSDREVPKTLDRLVEQGFEVEALQDLFLNESPGVRALYFSGRGPRIFLAEKLKWALRSTGVLRPPVPFPAVSLKNITPTPGLSGTPSPTPEGAFSEVEALLGPGHREGRVLEYSYPGEGSGPGEDRLGSFLCFQKVGEKVAAAGEWALSKEDLGKALGLFSQAGIQVTALRQQESGTTGGAFRLCFWALGNPAEIAKGFKTLWQGTIPKTPVEKTPEPADKN